MDKTKNSSARLKLAEKLHRQTPSDKRPVRRLASISFYMGDPTNARKWAEKLRELGPDDPYNLNDYYNYMANADVFEGNFKQVRIDLIKMYEQAQAINDSAGIFTTLNNLNDYYERVEQLDSMIYWATKAYPYAKGYLLIIYVFHMITYDPSTDARMRPLFDSIVTDFKETMPREIWGIPDAHAVMFDAILAQDTAQQIESSRKVLDISNDHHGDGAFELGRLLILFGDYVQGRERIEQFTEGQFKTNNAYRFLTSTWLLGRAYEGLGETDKAVAKYQEFLKFWGNADLQIKSIKDAKERLARLRS